MTTPERASRRETSPAVWRTGDASPTPGAVVAIGNFDGVHRGHQQLIALARDEAARSGERPGIVTFDPHPRDHFRPDDPSFRLTSERAKLKIMAALGVEVAFVLRFDDALAATGASDFVSDILAGELRLSEVIVGANFHFGRGRQGTPDTLRDLAQSAGMRSRVVPAVDLDGEAVSSSRIRAALEAGDIATANGLLGYRWFVTGAVQHGEKLGRTLGYPTANVALPPGCRLRHGIYAVRIATSAGEIRDGVASYGRRPTFDDGAPLLETFVFDFAGDLYGREVEVEFMAWIRGEERFGSAEALVARMDIDAAEARRALSAPNGSRSFIG